MEKQMTQWLEMLPCPALSVSNEKNVMCRNRLARRLLPPAARLRGQLFDFRDGFMKELLLDGVSYLVIPFLSLCVCCAYLLKNHNLFVAAWSGFVR